MDKSTPISVQFLGNFLFFFFLNLLWLVDLCSMKLRKCNKVAETSCNTFRRILFEFKAIIARPELISRVDIGILGKQIYLGIFFFIWLYGIL